MNEETALQKAFRLAGGQQRLAKTLGVSRQAVHQWQVVPAQHVLAVESATGISRHELRPDKYQREGA